MLVKLVVGLHIGAVSVISEAMHSGVDLLAAIIALVAVRSAGKPADADHPFGHAKLENISGAVEALLIFAAAGWIIREAVQKLLQPQPIDHLAWGVGVMLLSMLANIFVSRRLFAIGKETGSIALQADAWHLRTDVYTSAGVMGGLALIVIIRMLHGGNQLWIDPVTAIAVALLIVRAAYQLTIQATRDLLDTSLPPEEEAWIHDYITRLRPTVRGYHQLRTRKAGNVCFVEFHLIVERGMSIEDAHDISEVMECDIEEHFPASSVTIHVEPCDGSCQPVCVAGCLLTAEERGKVKGNESPNPQPLPSREGE